MPLLKKNTLEKAPLPEFLRDDEKVFHCEITNEIFRDYDDFAERTILCNSMVWTCSMTGKANLTYEEALQSENESKRTLADFPKELVVPVLFVANLTQRAAFSDLVEDVFLFVKDRYFVGEIVEALFSSRWKNYQVVQVVAPSPEEITKIRINKDKIPAVLYKYNLEEMDPEDPDILEKMMADMSQIRRKKALFTQSKCKLFLKQHVMQSSDHFAIKPSSLDELGVRGTKFGDIFDGPVPNFAKTTKQKKVRQQTLAKFLSKNNIDVIPKKPPVDNEKRELERQLKKERRMREREELRRKNVEIAVKLREWHVPKEDLLLEDQKEFPKLVPVTCKIPDKLFGEALCVMEFINNFSSPLNARAYFSNGVTLPVMERALTENKVAGPLIDIVILLLDALFTFQEEDNKAIASKLELERLTKTEFKELQCAQPLGTEEAVKLATQAATWSKKYQGFDLCTMPFTAVSVSEILRLHLLSSGARYIDSHGAKLRSYRRGCFNSEDDPAIHFRLHNSHILRQLSVNNIVELSIRDKLKLLNCLVNQLLTYKQIRDVVDEGRDKIRGINQELKQKHVSEKKRQAELDAEISKLRKQANEEKLKTEASKFVNVLEARNSKIEILKNSFKEATDEIEGEVDKLKNEVCNYISVFGYDRAFRRYMKLKSLPALLVNQEDKNVGVCLNEPVENVPELIGGDDDVVLKHIRKITEKVNTSDKENNTSDKENEPKEEAIKQNGHIGPPKNTSTDHLFKCSANPKSCIVHSSSGSNNQWLFVDTKEALEELTDSLNKRGTRECKLQGNLKAGLEILTAVIDSTPRASLRGLELTYHKSERQTEKENLGYPEDMSPNQILCQALIDAILDFEEKLKTGKMGGMHSEIRAAWRSNLENKRFGDVISQANGIKKDGLIENDTDPLDYQDPINYTDMTLADVESDDSDLESDVVVQQSAEDKLNIEGLAIALLQLARVVKPGFLGKPLGDISKKKTSNVFETGNILSNWEISLMRSKSYSQICVHYGTLDHCVMWGRSSRRINCTACRKGTNADEMMICDNCDSGLHFYCARPKLEVFPTDGWICPRCIQEKEEIKRKEEQIEKDEDMEEDDGSDLSDEEPANCARCREIESGDVLRCSDCRVMYHLECYSPPMRRCPRSWTCKKCLRKSSYQNGEGKRDSNGGDENIQRSNRARDESSELPLHNVALQEMLVDVMKHEDAWAFITPVQKREVPDYYEVISKPMDFGTIKYKLNMGKYMYDEELMADVRLVFENCNMYNSSDDEVYQCGIRLLKYFHSRCKRLKLKAPEDLEFDDEEVIERKSKRSRRE